MSESGNDTDMSDYDATLFPVFVTADIGLETINACLERSAEYTADEGLDGQQALYLISDPDAPHPKEPMDLPVTSFTSPFIGKTVDEIVEIFESKVSAPEDGEGDLMSGTIFVILDEQSKRDNMAKLVQIDEDGIKTARCEFEIAAIYAMAPEMGTMELGEGEEGFGEREVVVSKERYEQLMAEDENMSDDFDEDEEEEEEDDDE